MADKTTSHPPHSQVIIVGAGPIGLEMAIALRNAGISYRQFDARQIGYTISWFAPQTRFFSSNERIAIAGVPLQTWDQGKCTREEYLAYLRRIVQQYDLPVQTFEPVKRIEKQADRFIVTTEKAGVRFSYSAQQVILATGGTDRPRLLNIPGENLPHVDHYFRDPHLYFRRRLLVVGGKNSAVEAALRCHHAGAHVTISYRKSALDPQSIKYWLSPEINGLISAGQMQAHFDTVPTRITPTEVELASTTGKPGFIEPFDFVLLLIGYEADMSLLRDSGVQLLGNCQAPVFDDKSMETNIPGLFVAGCAIGGTQDKYAVYLENSHVHVQRILAALLGAPRTLQAPAYARPES